MRHHLSEIIHTGHRFMSLFLLALCITSVQAQIELKFDLNNRGDLVTEDHYGIFYEEINHAGDGGLYAELVRNRSFEEDMSKLIGWSSVGNAEMSLTTDKLLNAVQLRALKVNLKSDNAGVRNEGYWGINIVNGREYDLSFWLCAEDSYDGTIVAELQNKNGQGLGSASISVKASQEWQKYTAKISATGSDAQGYLALKGDKKGVIFLDVVSLFPPTFKGRKNGCRPDLAQMLADMHPRFMRFPGGCYIEGSWGDGQTNRFEWKKTIGPIEERPGHMNRNWDYKVTDGQGYHEYLELAEDLGANAMFVVNMGIGHDWRVDENDIDPFIQEALDAIEYANGSTDTYYGRLRAQNGHPEPFNLKYLEIGNEQEFMLNRNDYMKRYMQFYHAIKTRWPNLHLIADSYLFDDITEPVELKDEHYYESPEFFISQYGRYDNQSKSTTHIYVGEYAVTKDYGTLGNMNAAIGEAVFMQGCENNSEAVRMMSYAPIFTHEDNFNWRPDMIRFNSSMSYGTPSYHVQKMFSNNIGKQNIRWTEKGNGANLNANQGSIGFATWATAATFTDLQAKIADGTVITGNRTGSSDWSTVRGSWSISNGTFRQTNASQTDVRCWLKNAYDLTTLDMTVHATKQSGSEGFLIIFNYIDENNYAWLNLGGWSNSKHAVEQCQNGFKSVLGEKAGSLTTGKDYTIRIQKEGQHVRCYLDGEVIIEATLRTYGARTVYTSASIDDETGMMYVKIVNPSGTQRDVKLSLAGGHVEAAEAEILSASRGTDENTTSNPQRIVPRTQQLFVNDDNTIAYTCPAYSVGVIRLQVNNVTPPQPDPLPEPVLSFSFEKGKAIDDGGKYTCELMGKASIITLEDGNHVLATGGKGEGSYMNIPVAAAKQTFATVKDYTISINMLQRVGNNTGKFCWAYSMEQGTDHYIGLVNKGGNSDWYYEIKGGSTEGAHSYAGVSIGDWHNITYTQQGNVGRIYVDGHLKNEVNMTVKPSSFINDITRFTIGHSPFTSDAIMENALFDDFLIFDTALSPEQVMELGRCATAMEYTDYKNPDAERQDFKNLVMEVKNYVNDCGDDDLKQAYNSTTRVLNSSSSSTSAINNAYESLKEAVAAYQQGQLALARSGRPANLTFLITNSSFTRYNVGWQGADLSVAYNGYANETAEQYSRPFDIWQELQGLPAGTYTLTCKAFYRAGSIEAGYQAWRSNASSTQNAQLYMNDVTATVPNLYSSSAYTYNPYTYPDNLNQASSALNDASAYAPVSVSIDINEGETLRLGLRKQAIVSSDWVAYDHFQLIYEGGTTDVVDVSSDPSGNGYVYDLQGRFVRKSPENLEDMPKGVYIIKGEKVLVK
ncbi:MAG: carbohydrate binding domain-containing protein [Paludibacteraceae bacterium]|nr:carbohydrate binding domain-containing protein [Paludibacteraceae bacterium]